MSIKEILQKARALISDPAKWTTGVCARNERGIRVDTNDPTASCFCAAGAVCNIEPVWDRARPVWDLLDQVAIRKHGKHVATVNDNQGHAAVLEIFDEAIKEAE